MTLSSLYERRILKEYTHRGFALFTLLPSGSGRMESAQRLLSPGWASAPLFLHTSSRGRRTCGPTSETVPFQQRSDRKTAHHTQPSSAGRENQENHHANPAQLGPNLGLLVCLGASTFMARMHLVTIKTRLWRKAWQHLDADVGGKADAFAQEKRNSSASAVDA